MKKLLTLALFISFCVVYAQEKPSVKNDSIKKWKVIGKATFLFNQTSFSNWTSGGDNSIAGNLGLNYDFNYKKDRWNWDNKLISSFGLSYVDGQGYRKTDDRFELNSLLGNKIGGYWFASFFTNFKTQYARGYDYSKEPKLGISDFFSPAYLTFAPGFLWKKSDDFRVNITPATARFIFVSDEFSGKFGVEEGKNTNFGFGFNLSAYYKFKVMENVLMENNLSLYSDYLDKPENVDIDYLINFNVKANKFLTMTLSLHTIMDSNASGKLQFKEGFGFGVNYTFHEI